MQHQNTVSSNFRPHLSPIQPFSYQSGILHRNQLYTVLKHSSARSDSIKPYSPNNFFKFITDKVQTPMSMVLQTTESVFFRNQFMSQTGTGPTPENTDKYLELSTFEEAPSKLGHVNITALFLEVNSNLSCKN